VLGDSDSRSAARMAAEADCRAAYGQQEESAARSPTGVESDGGAALRLPRSTRFSSISTRRALGAAPAERYGATEEHSGGSDKRCAASAVCKSPCVMMRPALRSALALAQGAVGRNRRPT